MDKDQLPLLSIAERDFRPIAHERRQHPPRVKSVSMRLYVDKIQEHREAYEFLQRMQDLHGDGGKTIVRALLHYRDSVVGSFGESGQQRPRRIRGR